MKIAVETALDQMIRMGLVEVTTNSEGEEVYRLTESGKKHKKAKR